jgi:MFS family permease
VRRRHYAWTVAAVTFVVLLVAAGIRSTPGVLIVPLEQEFGWSRAAISAAIAIHLVLYGLIGPFAAAVIDRFGVRRTLGAALLALATGVGLTAFMQHRWQLALLWGVVVGTGTGFIGLTDRRVIIQDKSFVGKRFAITSIPYSKITSVSVVSNKSWGGSFFSTGAIAIHVGTHTYEVEFRGAQKSHHVHNVILHYIS